MPDDVLHVLAEDCGRDAEMFVDTITSVATGEQPEAALPLCLLALAQVQLMGARLGAMEDVVLDERFEADAGPDAEIEELRDGLALMFAGSLSGDLTEIASSLAHGHAHLVAGRITEALWWWQFDYLADWGERAAAAMRAIHALVAHVRLDIDPDVVAEAEFDALHP